MTARTRVLYITELPKRRVALIGTGWTISSIGRDSLDVWEYMDAGKKVGPDELLARVPETAQVAEIVPVPFQSVAFWSCSYSVGAAGATRVGISSLPFPTNWPPGLPLAPGSRFVQGRCDGAPNPGLRPP